MGRTRSAPSDIISNGIARQDHEFDFVSLLTMHKHLGANVAGLEPMFRHVEREHHAIKFADHRRFFAAGTP